VREGAVSQWLKRARTGGGREALRSQPHSGPTPKLTAEQRQHIPTLLARGAHAFGFIGDLWTTKRVALVIKETFGVTYHPAHISRLRRRLGLSVQLPTTRATQRNEAAVETWDRERWPALKIRPNAKVDPSSG